MNKTYKILLDGKLIGKSRLENAEPSLGVVTGLIEFYGVESPYLFLKEYCLKNNIIINQHDPALEFIDTQVIPGLIVVNPKGIEIKGVAGNAICGMKTEGYEISVMGIEYPFYKEEFPHQSS